MRFRDSGHDAWRAEAAPGCAAKPACAGERAPSELPDAWLPGNLRSAGLVGRSALGG